MMETMKNSEAVNLTKEEISTIPAQVFSKNFFVAGFLYPWKGLVDVLKRGIYKTFMCELITAGGFCAGVCAMVCCIFCAFIAALILTLIFSLGFQMEPWITNFTLMPWPIIVGLIFAGPLMLIVLNLYYYVIDGTRRASIIEENLMKGKHVNFSARGSVVACCGFVFWYIVIQIVESIVFVLIIFVVYFFLFLFWFIWIIPFVGQIVASIVLFALIFVGGGIFSAYTAVKLHYLSRGIGQYGKTFGFFLNNFLAALGLVLACGLMMLIPVVNVFAVVFCVVGVTKMMLHFEYANQNPRGDGEVEVVEVDGPSFVGNASNNSGNSRGPQFGMKTPPVRAKPQFGGNNNSGMAKPQFGNKPKAKQPSFSNSKLTPPTFDSNFSPPVDTGDEEPPKKKIIGVNSQHRMIMPNSGGGGLRTPPVRNRSKSPNRLKIPPPIRSRSKSPNRLKIPPARPRSKSPNRPPNRPRGRV